MAGDKWDRRFLDLAAHVAQWSKDPSTKVGAVLARDKRVISIGYNGFPPRVEDSDARLGDRLRKYTLIIHAEENAILFAGGDTRGCTLYTWPFMPCASCARIIIQSGVSRVVAPAILVDRWKDNMALASEYLLEAGVVMDLVDDRRGTLKKRLTLDDLE